MEQHDIAFLDAYALRFFASDYLFTIKCGAFFEHVFTHTPRHVQHQAASDHSRQVFHAKFSDPVHSNEVFGTLTVVINAICPRVTKPIDLRTNPHPTGNNVISIVKFILAYRGAVVLIWYDHLHAECARRKSGCAFVSFYA